MIASKNIFEYFILGLEFAGSGFIVFGILFSFICALVNLAKKIAAETIYRSSRIQLGRFIILGLEVLIAADIIRSITIQSTFRSIGILAAIVIIRTFLSFSLELEMTGKWPWQKT